MRVLLVFAHPSVQSFNQALLEVVRNALIERGAEVRLKDLYQIGFDPVLKASDFESIRAGTLPDDIRREQADIAWADRLIFLYPVWWFERPAILKGWIDRVWLNGFAFSAGPSGAKGLLKHEKALVIQTAGNPEQDFHEQDAVDVIHLPMTLGTLRYCGIRDIQVKTFFGTGSATAEQRDQWLQEARKLIQVW